MRPELTCGQRNSAPSRQAACRLAVGVFCAMVASAGMALPAQGEDAPAPKQRTVALLLFEGVELLDFAGPAEVFIVTQEGQAFRVVTVAESTKPLRTMGGVKVTPDFSYRDAPRADILVVPGGAMGNVSADGLAWIKKSAGEAEIVMSVCMGASLLARAKLLDKIEVTTHAWGQENLRRAAPTCKVVAGRRFVDSGKIITTGGVTAGIDGALHVVRRLLGDEAGNWTAKEWMEYPHEPQSDEQSK